jgi:aldose 1-epimerase
MKKAACLGVILFAMPAAAQYAARRAVVDGVEVIVLEDKQRATTVSIAPSIGNNAFEMKVNGKNIFWFPFASVGEFRKKPALCGNPLLAPWANRLDENAFYANGKKYALNMDLGNVRLDGFKHPIHGLLLYASDWVVTVLKADRNAALVTSRLDFARRPDWMAQFPFAHTIEMTYILSDGALEVSTRVENTGAETMPLSLGYHPYFQVHDAPRDDWTVGLGAASEWLLSKELIPTGETRPIGQLVPNPDKVALRGLALDNVFGELVRDKSGRTSFWVQGKSQKIEVLYGPKYPVAVVYAPTGANRSFICFEPMTGITNAFNLAYRGVYKALQMIPAGGSWQESFWLRPTGF